LYGDRKLREGQYYDRLYRRSALGA
jgi:hypothetical protein